MNDRGRGRIEKMLQIEKRQEKSLLRREGFC